MELQTTKTPPQTFFTRLQFLGPGFILSASIVGSGELIATTVLGAKAGFALLWVIIISCLAKVALQLEFGKHAITTGQTSIEAFDQLPGIRIGKAHWSVWLLLIMLAFKIIQVGGILGGTSVVVNMLFPAIPLPICAVIVGLGAAALIFNGEYKVIEKASLLMIALFTLFTMLSLFMLHYTPYDFSWHDLTKQRYTFSKEELAVAFGAFGITGVASDEIIIYKYWCIEKGYARFTGAAAPTNEWVNRAKGWLKVMYMDAALAMIIYTSVTVAFYLLGAAILHGNTAIPNGNEVIETLAMIYTQTLGREVKLIYLTGAFFVLFSSVFATLAAWTRIFPDLFHHLNWIKLRNEGDNKKIISYLSIIFPALWIITFLFIQQPVLMVLSGGIVGSFMLLLVVYVGINFRYQQNQYIKSTLIYDTILWISIISIAGVALTGLYQLI